MLCPLSYVALVLLTVDPRVVHAYIKSRADSPGEPLLVGAQLVPTASPSPTTVPATTIASSTTADASQGTKTTTTGPDQGRIVAWQGYIHDPNTGKYVSMLPMIQNPSGITHVILFVTDIHSTGPPLTIGGDVPNNNTALGELWEEVGQLQKYGLKVMTSLGGFLAESFMLLEQDFDKWYPPLRDFLKDYDLDGLDLDIETSNKGTTPSKDSLLQLIKAVKQDFGDGFFLTMTPVAPDLTNNPSGFSGFSYAELDKDAIGSNGEKLIDFYNAQLYNSWGYCNETIYYDNIMSAGWEPERVVMTCLSGAVDGSGYYPLDVIVSTGRALRANYPKLGGIGGYEWFNSETSDQQRWQWYAGASRVFKASN